MLSALFSFLGGSVFRMIWGEVSSFVNRQQDHAFEIERLKLQNDFDDRAHQRSQEAIKLQAELGVKTIQAQAESDVMSEEAKAFTEAMKNAFKPTGIYWVDAWNAVIRPAAATVALGLWVLKLSHQGFIMQDYDMEITGVVLGFFFADRSLGKRGK
jgi:hypothetical protein